MPESEVLPPLPLPSGLTERQVTSPASELSFHIIEAGAKGRPLLLLLHGFPELAYSWRKVMPGLAAAGFYVVAVDQRGYGRTTGWDTASFEDVDLSTFSIYNLIRDMVVLVHTLGYTEVHCVVGHDFGAVSASLCALARPDFFHRIVLMSHPFKAPVLDLGPKKPDIHRALAELPEPRKHYKWYYSTAAANKDMSPREGLREFIRDYFYMKSADWDQNKPHRLTWTAEDLAKMPQYYIMPLDAGMRDVMVHGNLSFMTDAELGVYTEEYARTGFQGGLNWYRVQTGGSAARDVGLFAGKKIEVPCLYIAGKQDWGSYQEAGALEGMGSACTKLQGVELIDGAGHWVQQEQPEKVVEKILGFLKQ